MKSSFRKVQAFLGLLLLIFGLVFSSSSLVAKKGGSASSSSGHISSDVSGFTNRTGNSQSIDDLAVYWLNHSQTHRTIAIWDNMPHLKVRVTDFEEQDSQVREEAQRVLNPMFDREINPNRISVALTLPVRDSTTEKRYIDLIPSRVREKGQEFVTLLDKLTDSNTNIKQQIEFLKPWKGELIILIGHRNPETGFFEYVTEDGKKTNSIDIFTLEQRAAEAGVLVLAIGCRSARNATIGPERDINSVEAVEDVAGGITAISTGEASLRTLFGALATERMALSIDLLSFKDTRRLETVDERGNVLGGTVVVPPLIILMSSLAEPEPSSQSIYEPSRVIVPSCPGLLSSIISARFQILWVILLLFPAFVLWELLWDPETEGWAVLVYGAPMFFGGVFVAGILINEGIESASEANLDNTLLTILLIASISLFFTWRLSFENLRSRWSPAVGGVLLCSLVGFTYLYAFLCGPK